MRTRDGLPFPLCWVLVNLGHARINQLVAAAEEDHRAALDAELSVNRNAANTQALVKVASDGEAFSGKLPGNVRNAIVRVFTPDDHHEALALVSAAEWAGEV